MDPVERIIQKIMNDVEWKVREYENEAQAKIAKIREEEYTRWEEEERKLRHDGEREAEGIRSFIVSRAHLEGKRKLMETREKVMGKVIEEIKRLARNSKGYENYLREKIEEARKILGDEFRVICIPEDKGKVDSIIFEVAPKAKVEMGQVKYGGIIAVSMDSLKKVDYSIDSMIGRRMNEIRRKIAEKLFEGEYA